MAYVIGEERSISEDIGTGAGLMPPCSAAVRRRCELGSLDVGVAGSSEGLVLFLAASRGDGGIMGDEPGKGDVGGKGDVAGKGEVAGRGEVKGLGV